jgi:5-methylcytosine-specific restriction endonuclease McrA
MQSPKGKAAHAKYMQSPKGKATGQRTDATRRAHKNGASYNLPRGWRTLLRAEQDECCFLCGVQFSDTFTERSHLAHLYTALANGGGYEVSNVVLLCQSCNNAQHAEAAQQFLTTHRTNRQGRRLITWAEVVPKHLALLGHIAHKYPQYAAECEAATQVVVF